MRPKNTHRTLQHLQEVGYKVNVRHHRRFVVPYRDGFKHQNFVLWQAPEGGVGPLGNGGFCEVTVTTPDGTKVHKLSHTPDYDPEHIRYNRRLLTSIALGRCVHQLTELGLYK